QSDDLLGIFRESVLVVRIDSFFFQQAVGHGCTAVRALQLPLPTRQLYLRTRRRQSLAMNFAIVLSFAIYRLRRRHDHLLYRKLLLADNFIKQRGSNHIGVEELAVVRHIVLIGRFVKNKFDSREHSFPRRFFSHIARNKLHTKWKLWIALSPMYAWLKIVQNSDFDIAGDQRIHDMGADESRPSCNQCLQVLFSEFLNVSCPLLHDEIWPINSGLNSACETD